MANKDKGIMIFKETFEYMMEGMITEEQFGKLMKMVYQTRWEDGVDESTIEDKELKLIWKTLKHVVLKSKTNSNQYKNKIGANTEFDNENDTTPQTTTESPSKGQETPKNEVMNEVRNEVKNEAPNEVITTSPEIFINDDDDKDLRYGEIDTTNPMMSFLRDDEPEKDNKIDKKIDNKKDKKDMDYTEVAKGYIEQMDGITFNSPEWHQKLISIIKENEPHLRWGAIYETANRIMQNAA